MCQDTITLRQIGKVFDLMDNEYSCRIVLGQSSDYIFATSVDGLSDSGDKLAIGRT